MREESVISERDPEHGDHVKSGCENQIKGRKALIPKQPPRTDYRQPRDYNCDNGRNSFGALR